MSTVILLGACGSAGINFARCVRSEWVRVVAVDSDATKLSAYKDLEFDEIVLMPELSGPEAFRGFIIQLLREHDADAVHAQSNILVEKLMEAAAGFQPLDKYIWNHSVVQLEACRDKMNLQKMLIGDKSFRENIFSGASVGLFFGDNEAGWLRLREGTGSRAALPVESEGMAEEWMRYWMTKMPKLVKGDFVITPILPGREFAVQALHLDNGECLHMQAIQRSESVDTITSDDSIYDQAREYLKTLQSNTGLLSGIYGVDMKEDENGKCIMTKINYGGFYSTSEFLANAGVNTPVAYLNTIKHGYFNTPIKINSVDFDHKWVRTLDAEPVMI